ncbi:MAG: ATP-binding protein [Clostridium sp.]|nr:ATP-binding protein [Clostridium sp.]
MVYNFFLSLLQALFLDMKMNIFTNAGLCVSAVLVCIVQPSELPYGNIMFQDIVVRCGVTFLIMMLITIMVYCSGQVLLNLKEQKQRWILQYVEKVDENQHQIRELKHNMKNQMIVLKSLIEENDVEEANAFIGNMIENTESLSNGIFTGNASINSILNSKINDSKRYNIDWDIEINVPRNINMGSSDIGIIIGNLLDNAIEACARIKDDNRKIKVNIESNSMNMIISVVNTKNEGEIKEKTWKTDKENHGIGLKSVQRVVNKYNGAMRNEDKGNLYDVNIILWYKGIS